MSYEQKIIVALDFDSLKSTQTLIEQLQQQIHYVKVGMEAFYSQGFPLIEYLQKKELAIFLDLKIHDIPNTAKQAAKSLAQLGVQMLNAHCSGGLAMLESFNEGLIQGSQQSQRKKPLSVGVTQLTSSDDKTLRDELKVSLSISDCVTHYASLAKKAGLDGVVASAHEVSLIKKTQGNEFLTITPGIRPQGSDRHDQKRVCTPSQALKQLGSDYIVIGRAITKAQDPLKAWQQINRELNHG